MKDVIAPGEQRRPLRYTGERLLTATFDTATIEHLHRYAFALTLCEGKSVVDIACGEGYGANLLAQVARSVRGVDISGEALAHATGKYKKANLSFIQGSASAIPINNASVDVVTSFETIEHHPHHAEMMTEIKRVLRPDGLLIISSPDKLHYTDIGGADNPFHVKELYKEEFQALLESHFDHVEMLSQRIYYGSLIVPDGYSQGFTQYWGDHYQVQTSSSLPRPLYNICLASDSELAPLAVSFYDGAPIFDSLWKSLYEPRALDVIKSAARSLLTYLRKLVGK